MAGRNDLHLAVQMTQKIIETERGLATPGAVPGRASVCMHSMGEVKRLLEGGENVNYRDSTSRTPLDYCVVGVKPSQPGMEHCRDELLQLLFEHGGNPNLKDSRGWTVMHQAAWNGDLHMLQQCLQRGKGNCRSRNEDGQLPVDLAVVRNHAHIMRYLDAQSCDLSSMCRGVIRQALGKRCKLTTKLHLPPRLKLFLQYNIPYPGFSMVVVPLAPWTPAQLHQQDEVQGEELREFITDHASEDFLAEHADNGSLEEKAPLEPLDVGATCDQELVRLFQKMYLWEAFKTIEYAEPLPRQPRYSLEMTRRPAINQTFRPVNGCKQVQA